MTAIVQVAGVTPGDPVVEKIAALYHAAFPPAERVPFPRLLQHPLPGYTDGLWAFTHNGQFCGFMTTITRGDITLIGYFAMVAALRGHGFGSVALQLMRQRLPQQRLALEIEVLDPAAANYAQRLRRRNFYQRNGYRLTDIEYRAYGVPFVVMLSGADIGAREYHAFYDPLIQS